MIRLAQHASRRHRELAEERTPTGVEALLREAAETLQQARHAARGDIESLSRAPYLDRRALLCLDRRLRDEGRKAEALGHLVASAGASEDLGRTAADLAQFFREARAQVEAWLASGRP